MSVDGARANIDPAERDKFDRLAASWWDPRGDSRPLHELNPARMRFIEERVRLDGARVVDVGCGGGILSESMARFGADVTGIDVVEKNINVARLHAQQEALSIDYRLMTASELADSGKRFDVVLNMEVVEHVADLAAFMHDCNRLTDDNGVMFVATINRTPLAWLFAIFGAEYILRWLPRGTHRYRLLRKPAEIRTLLAEGGLAVGDITGVAVNPFTRTLRRTRLTSVNYMMCCSRDLARRQ